MLATRCSCGFVRLDDEEVTDHLLAAFETQDATGNDGQAHQELAAADLLLWFPGRLG